MRWNATIFLLALNRESQSMEGVNPFKVFNLPQNFTFEQLKARFKELVLKHHPDRNNIDSVKTTPMFQIISGCYKMLLNELELREREKAPHELRNGSRTFVQQQEQRPYENVNFGGVAAKKKFDLERFNKIFNELRIKDELDDGYERWMSDPSSFDKKHNRALIKYQEPEPLVGSKAMGNFYELGQSKVDDFSGTNMTARNLNYMDYRVAYTTHTLVDESVIDPRRQYKSVNDIEADRANVSFTMSQADLQKLHMQKQKQEAIEKQRLANLARRDEQIVQQWTRANKMMLGR